MFAVILFPLATLLPLALIAAGALWGGPWVAAALACMTLLTYLLDQLVAVTLPPAADEGQEFPAADGLCVVLALGHFVTLALVVRELGVSDLGPWAKVGLTLAAGLWLGQVGNATAHELIHRGPRPLHRLGKWMYISLLYGHHTSAHVLIHHRLVATPDDPATAPQGQGFWAYAPRAWIGAFRLGYAAESARLDRVGRAHWHNPYLAYVAGGLLMPVLAVLLGGWPGLVGYLCLVTHAQVQLLLSDYVQHYGLTRRTGPGGKPEPVGPRHSWNAPQWFTGAMMLNAPRHADHHAHPARAFPTLRLEDDGPTLPRSLPAMATLALVPPLWRRVMDRRVQRWQAT